MPPCPDLEEVLCPERFAAYLTPRATDSHKGSFGTVGIIGGENGMMGALILAGQAALMLGAGKIYLGFLADKHPSYISTAPELMVKSAADLLATNPLFTVLACGPGLGQLPAAMSALKSAINCPQPLILDADALNLLAAHPALKISIKARPTPTILTPHPMEAARLLNTDVATIQQNRRASAQKIAADTGAIVALKGRHTLIAQPDGSIAINHSGNPGLASAGTGDVLTGLIAALIAQGWPALAATQAAVHLHGAAAEFACCTAEKNLPACIGLTAHEIIPYARSIFNHWHRENL